MGRHVHLVLHVGKIGQFIVEMAIEELNPEHQLALFVPRYKIVEVLEAGDE